MCETSDDIQNLIEHTLSNTGAGGHHPAQNHHVRDVKSWYVVPLSIKPQRFSNCLSFFFLLLKNAPYTLPKCFSKRNFKKSEKFGTEYPL